MLRALGGAPAAAGRRSAAKAARGKVGGASLTLLLATGGKQGDPTCEVTADPVVAWEAAAWDATVARSILVKAWRRQQMEAGMQGGWRGVRGSAGACTMSMKRAG